METKILIILIIIIGMVVGFYLQQKPEISEEISPEEQLKNLSSIILKNTKFENFSADRISFKCPNWEKVEIDPILIWPKEIVEKEKILLYLTNTDGMTMVVAKRELALEDLVKPYPLIFREALEKERRIMEEKGGLTSWQTIKEDFFENGVILESRLVIFGMATTSISKSVIIEENGKGFIYSVGISAGERIFEDYRLVANYIIDSISYY
jgi:hypothetical protein